MKAKPFQDLDEPAARLGEHLRAGRRRRFPADTQGDFARRVGVSRYTYQKMEQGDPRVSLGSYLRAADLLGILEQVVAGFEPPRPSLFERRESTE